MPLQWPNVPTLPGRLSLDVLHYVSKNYKFSPPAGAYKLGAVSARFLDQNKEDIHFSMITKLQNGTSESRRRLAIYCAKVSKDNQIHHHYCKSFE
jgi:DNA polymerase delta subunit 1